MMKRCISCDILMDAGDYWEVDEGRYACDKCWHRTYKRHVEAWEARQREFDQDLTGQDQEAWDLTH